MVRRLSVILFLAATGCASDAGPDDDGDQTALEMFSWWTSPGEAEALDALVSAHNERFPEVSLSNIVVSNVGINPELLLRQRLFGEGATPPNPPDLMQWNVNGVESFWVSEGASFESLDAVFEEEGWLNKFRPDVLADCQIDGHYVVLPVGMHRENSLMFNKQLLADAGAAVPTDWDSFVEACDKVEESGKTCLALTQEGWVQDILLRNVAIMTMGPDAFHAYFTGQGERDDARIDEVAANFDFVLENYVGGRDAMRVSGWDEAAKDLFRNDTAFFMHGDWAVGLYKTLGWNEQDFGVIAAPGSSSLFVYTADGFLVPTGGDDLAASLDVIRTFGDPDTLARFAEAKGASPPRVDVDVGSDPLAAAVYADLQNATHVMLIPSSRVADSVYADFLAKTTDTAALAEAIRNTMYPLQP